MSTCMLGTWAKSCWRGAKTVSNENLCTSTLKLKTFSFTESKTVGLSPGNDINNNLFIYFDNSLCMHHLHADLQ